MSHSAMAARKKRKRRKRSGASSAPAGPVSGSTKSSPKKKKQAAKNAPDRATPESSRRAGWGLWLLLVVVAAGILAMVLWPDEVPAGETIPYAYTVRVIDKYPHDRRAFTQGLLWHDGKLYESTGLYRQSTVRRVALDSGDVEARTRNDDEIFGEGLARVGDRLIQISWRENKAFVYDLETLEPIAEHDYDGEGWGLCYDGERLVMSDGSDELTFRDPDSFEETGRVQVKRLGRPLDQLNELECVDDVVYANVWQDDHIARIDPSTGEVTGWIDASGLLSDDDRTGGEDVLNGIAWVPERERFLLTGKNWPFVYEVELVPRQ